MESSRSPKMGHSGARCCPSDLLARPGPRTRQEVTWVGPTSSDALIWPIFTPPNGNPSIISRNREFLHHSTAAAIPRS